MGLDIELGMMLDIGSLQAARMSDIKLGMMLDIKLDMMLDSGSL